MLTRSQVASRLGISKTYVRKLEANGTLHLHLQADGVHVFDPVEIEAVAVERASRVSVTSRSPIARSLPTPNPAQVAVADHAQQRADWRAGRVAIFVEAAFAELVASSVEVDTAAVVCVEIQNALNSLSDQVLGGTLWPAHVARYVGCTMLGLPLPEAPHVAQVRWDGVQWIPVLVRVIVPGD